MRDSDETDLASRLDAAIEALRDAEGRATAAQQALETMHEIRNPLEALGNFVYLAGTAADKPDEVREYMRMADEQLSALREITSQPLSFSRADLAFREVDFVSIADAALRVHNRILQRKKKIHLVRDHTDSIVGSAHAGQMLQLISNMLANALGRLMTKDRLASASESGGHSCTSSSATMVLALPGSMFREFFIPFFQPKDNRGQGSDLPSRNASSIVMEVRFESERVYVPARVAQLFGSHFPLIDD